MNTYNPKDWYWQIGDDSTRFWSSKDKAFVTELPDGAQPSRIASEVELYDVLCKARAKAYAPSRTFTIAEVREALSHIDAGLVGDASDAASLAAIAEEIGLTLPPFA